MLSRSRSVTPADRSHCDLLDTRDPAYNFINSSRPPKILESPLDSKSLSAGNNNQWQDGNMLFTLIHDVTTRYAL